MEGKEKILEIWKNHYEKLLNGTQSHDVEEDIEQNNQGMMNILDEAIDNPWWSNINVEK